VLTITSSNVTGGPALIGANLSGAAPQNVVDASNGATFPFTVSSNPGPNPVIQLVTFSPLPGGGMGGSFGEGISNYAVSASLAKQ
jgi:hypothetical protein